MNRGHGTAQNVVAVATVVAEVYLGFKSSEMSGEEAGC